MQDTESKKKIEKLLAKEITNRDVGVLVDAVFKAKNVGKLKKYMEELVAEAVGITSTVRNKNLRDQLLSFASSTLEDL
jgi:hypothetical protein